MSFLRRIARGLAWPIRRLLEPRFGGVHKNIDFTREKVREDIDIYATTAAESLTYVGRQIDALEAQIRRLERRRDAEEGAPLTLEDLDPTLAELLNAEVSPQGMAGQAGLFFNHPVWLEYREGSVEVRSVNERVAEVPFAMRALASLRPPARILDVGSGESTLPLSLASLGYSVTALDPRPLRLRHPLLESVESTLEDFSADPGSYDAVCCISTVEHFGIGAYGEHASDEDADLAALARLRELVKPDGFLVLTVPFGEPRPGPDQRVYDEERLRRLLDGWEVAERELVTRIDRRTWVSIAAADAGPSGGESAALIVARPR